MGDIRVLIAGLVWLRVCEGLYVPGGLLVLVRGIFLAGFGDGSSVWSCGRIFGSNKGPCCLTGDLIGVVAVVFTVSGDESNECIDVCELVRL